MILKAYKIIDILNKGGYEGYIVGGFVRDTLLNRKCGDCDITTNALPSDVKRLFKDFAVIPTGESHGTVTVLFDGIPFEITTYRSDGKYSDMRRPDSVKFVKSLKEDLARRDFTVNALCMDKEGNIIDYCGGKQDAENKIIKCVGDPYKRFDEDALRILRAIRFASVLGFEIESETDKAIRKMKYNILKVSAERIFSELTKMLLGENAQQVIIDYCDVLDVIIKGFKRLENFDQRSPYHKYDILTHIAKTVGNSENDPEIRFAALFHDVGKLHCFTVDETGRGHFKRHNIISAKIANKVLTELKAPRKFINNVTTLIFNHDNNIKPNEIAVKRMLNKMGKETFEKLIKLKKADNMSKGITAKDRLEQIERLYEIYGKIISENQCYSLKMLAVNGNDIMSLGYKGEEIGDKLDMLLNDVIEGRCKNEKTELIKRLGN